MIVCEESLTGKTRPSRSVFSFTRAPRTSPSYPAAGSGGRGRSTPAPARVAGGQLPRSKQACVTLQRPPPEMRTLERKWGPFSSSVTPSPGAASAQVIAAKNPAAPPPTTMTCRAMRDGG